MSLEEKAKAYDEALERAKEYHIDVPPLHQSIKDVIEYIFPEIKDLEDERIKEFLIRSINQVSNDSFLWETVTKSSVLAWIEKSKRI